ncbi:hypothetical protein ACIBL5_34095 [Streptomyces sp. NPDC050516]|uniref:hypothetical protein n=1 Tax=Streptomyces sp. NPDC050516 TaxID=3365621 RepID=UPI0037933585
MRKPRKTAVVAVLISAVGFLGTGTAYAHGDEHQHAGQETKTLVVNQSNTCSTVEDNADVQGQSGYQNGLEGNRSNSKGSPGTQNTNVGSGQGCDNTVIFGK